MTKFKLEDNIWKILLESFKIYFKNIGQFTRYMLFPVFGQIIGLWLMFGLTWWFVVSLPTLLSKYAFLNNFMTLVICIILITVPGFIIALKAFWDYMVAFGALNSMTDAITTTGKLYDLNAHTQVITQHSFKFIGLLFVIGLMFLIGAFPLFWVIGLIFFIYFILVFQIFTLEPELSIFDCFKRSLNLIKGNFARTLLIAIILSVISHWLINSGILALCNFIKLSEILKGIFENWASELPLGNVNGTLVYYRLPAITELEVANGILSSTILFLVTGLTLPLRSVCWTLWYKNLACKQEEFEKETKKGK